MAQQDYSVAGNLRVIGSTTMYGNTTIVGQVAIGNSALNLATFASNMIGNVNAANAAIVAANTSMKAYVDTGIGSALFAASSYGNAVVAAYLPVDPSIVSINSAITLSNSNINAINSNITAANLNIASVQSNITAANANISATYSNVRLLQSNVEYIRANVLANGAVLASNIFLPDTGNISVGNINASGNLVMAGIDATTIRFVRSPDTTVNPGEVYGNIDFAGEDSTTGAAGTRARISVLGSGTVGQTEISLYTTGSGLFFGTGSTSLILNLRSNTQGAFGACIGYNKSIAGTITQSIGRSFDPVMNDSSTGTYISNPAITSQWTDYSGEVNSFNELVVAHRFTQTYAGFAGGDRANISLTAYHSALGGSPLAYTDNQQSDVEFHVQGVYVQDPSISPPVVKRLRKRWIATISYASSTGNWTVLDQVLQEAVYNSDATNWPAGAVNASKVFLQANVTAGSQDLVLRLEAPTGAAVTSSIHWQITTKIRTIEFL
jgi:hypothetical protein